MYVKLEEWTGERTVGRTNGRLIGGDMGALENLKADIKFSS